jgi:beta-hydroxylase
MTDATAFKVLTQQQWADFERERVFRGAPVDIADGYIHLSTAEQLETTIAKYFAGQSCLMIAEVDLICLGDAIRWEPARDGDLFPHIYAELPMHAVVGLQKRDQ